MTKKNNPFRLWGSYVGAVIGLIYVLFKDIDFFGCSGTGINLLTNNFKDCIVSILGVWYIVIIIVGFIIGWQIHKRLK